MILDQGRIQKMYPEEDLRGSIIWAKDKYFLVGDPTFVWRDDV